MQRLKLFNGQGKIQSLNLSSKTDFKKLLQNLTIEKLEEQELILNE